MADVLKTIEIEMKANLRSLQTQLSKIPGMTKKEAQLMTRALQKELKQAQVASKKTAKINKEEMSQLKKDLKSAQAAAIKTAAVNKKAMKDIAGSTKIATKATKNLRTQSREMGGAFGALEDVISEVSPELGAAAMAVGTFGQAFRALSRSLATGNPLVLAVIVSAAALAATYHMLTSAGREAERQQKLLEEATKKLNDKLKEQRDIANEVVSAHRSATLELEVFTGQVSKLDAQLIKSRDAAAEQLDKQLGKQDKFIDEQKKSISLVHKAKTAYSTLTEEEVKQLELLMASSEKRLVNQGILSTSGGFTLQMNALQGELNDRLKVEQGFRNKIITANEKTQKQREDLIKLQAEYAKEQEEEAKRQERIAKARAAALERERTLLASISDAQKTRESSEDRIFSMQTSRLAQEDQINANAKRRSDALKEDFQTLEDQFDANVKIAKSKKDKAKLQELDLEAARALATLHQEESEVEKQRLHDIAELRKKLREDETKEQDKADKERAKKDKEAVDQYIALQNVRIKAVTDIFAFGLQLATEAGNENKELINVLFRANQGAALADIYMSTAQAVAAAPAQYGPFAPAAIPAIIAGGAVQAGIVLAQKPPLHMGGIVQPLAPDEQQRTVLSGEAVLDRATTRRLGEDGIRNLQNGKGGGAEIIVMNPFKHLDRYNRSALRNPNSSFSRMKPTKRQRY